MPAASQTHLCGTSQPAWLPQPQLLPGTSDQRPESWELVGGAGMGKAFPVLLWPGMGTMQKPLPSWGTCFFIAP